VVASDADADTLKQAPRKISATNTINFTLTLLLRA